uniref:Uncharacterized protein n=1 Tax=Siphoviridae sp. ctouo22 TaxID=2826463 RepID=A0A8S5MRX4_9CAUD|nr:MAG TPA: hypothetical protein [Siphoviridae sp. ctouo22]
MCYNLKNRLLRPTGTGLINKIISEKILPTL